jgi:hypothetical protein
MSKKFDVYKWRQDNLLTEDVSNGTRADYVYNAIKEYLAPNYQDQMSANSIKRQIMYGLMEADRSESPLQENKLRGSWVDKKGTFDGKGYDGYFKTTFSKQDSEVKAAMKDKGYTYVDSEEWDDDDRKTEYWYYFKK